MAPWVCISWKLPSIYFYIPLDLRGSKIRQRKVFRFFVPLIYIK
jgi:hypothetical protein